MSKIKVMTYLLSILLPFAVLANEPKDWTVYIHMNGDNSLCSYAGKDMAELKSLDVSSVANIIVAYDCSKRNDSKLLHVKGSVVEVLDEGKEYDMGDEAFFTKTVLDVFDVFPSEKRMVVLWNHGSGWKNLKIFTDIDKGISYDDDSGNHITTPELGKAFDIIGAKYKVDLLGFDACLMQMIEVGYEVGSKAVDYIVASEETEPGDGWDYRGVVKSLATKPTPVELGSALVDSYTTYYNSTSVTQSVISVMGLEDFTIEWAAFLMTADMPKVKADMKKATSYTIRDYKDMGSFLSLYGADGNLISSYNNAVLYNKGKGTGFSIHYSDYLSSSYKDLKFSKDTGWLQ